MTKTANYIGLGLAMVLALASCVEEEISAADYNQACALNAECLVIAEGTYYEDCDPCPNAAINRSDEARFNSDVEAARSGTVSAACGSCQQTEPVCLASMCQMRIATVFDASLYDTACDDVSDCVFVRSTEACDSCTCEFAAVSIAGQAAWDARRAEVECGVTDQCRVDCGTTEVECVSNRCELVGD